MYPFTANQSPAEIVKFYPKASDFFKKYRIDFCCGGDRALYEVIQEKKLDGDMTIASLNTAYEDWTKGGHEVIDWDSIPASKLIDYIIDKHHAYLYEELPALGEFVTKIYRVHGNQHPHLLELRRLYHAFKLEMLEHTIKEDEEVFPLIKAYENSPSEELLQQIKVANGGLVDDHNGVGELLKQIREVTNDFTLPLGACNSYRITYARLAEMEDNTFEHIHLENNVLFKKL